MYNNDDDSDPDWEQFSEEVVGGGLHTNPLPEVVSLPPAAATAAAADGLQQQGAQEAKEDEGGWHDRYCGMHGSGDEEDEDEEEGEEATATPATAARSPGSMAITPIPTEPMEEGSGSGGGSSSDTESGCETVGFGSDEAEGSSDDGMSQDEEGAVGGVAFEEVDTDSLLDMLHTAAYNGDVEELQHLLALSQRAGLKVQDLIEMDERSGSTLLLTAADAGQDDVVQFLLGHGADAAATQPRDGKGALELAVEGDYVEVLKSLFAHDPSLLRYFSPSPRGDWDNPWANTSLALPAFCVERDAFDCLAWLLEFSGIRKRLNSEREELYDDTLFLHAVRQFHYRAAGMLLKSGANPRVRDNEGQGAVELMTEDADLGLGVVDPDEEPAREKLLNKILEQGAGSGAVLGRRGPARGRDDSDDDAGSAASTLSNLSNRGHPSSPPRPDSPSRFPLSQHIPKPPDMPLPPQQSHHVAGGNHGRGRSSVRERAINDAGRPGFYHHGGAGPASPARYPFGVDGCDSIGGIGGGDNTHSPTCPGGFTQQRRRGSPHPGRGYRPPAPVQPQRPVAPKLAAQYLDRTAVHIACIDNYPDSVDKLHAALKMVHGHALDNFRRYHHQQQHQASPQFQSHEQLEDAAHAFARAVVERELVRRDGSGSTPLIGAAKYGNVRMIKALLDYPNLPFLRQPSTAPTARAPIPPLDKHGCRPEEPYISLSLPLPAWAQDNVVQRSLEAVDTWLQYTALAWAVSDGYDMTARVLLEAGADPTFLVPTSFYNSHEKRTLVELAKYKGHHEPRWKLETALEAPEPLFLLLKARHVHEANMARVDAKAAGGEGVEPPLAARSSIIFQRLAKGPPPRGCRLRLPQFVAADDIGHDNDDDGDEDGRQQHHARRGGSTDSELRRARDCLDFAVRGLPPSVFAALVGMLDPGPWVNKVWAPEIGPALLPALQPQPMEMEQEEVMEEAFLDFDGLVVTRIEESDRQGKKPRPLSFVEKDERRKTVQRMEQAEKRLAAEEAAAAAEGTGKGKGGGDGVEVIGVKAAGKPTVSFAGVTMWPLRVASSASAAASSW